MSSFTVTRLDEIPEVTDGREPWRPIRHHLGITAFGVNAWTGAAAGDRILNEHDESDEGDSQEELYLVLSGRAAFEVDGERLDGPAGTLVYVRPGVKRTAFAEEADTTVLAIGGTPGKAYEPTGWEVWAPIGQLYQAGDYAKAADVGREALEEHPQYPELFYNVACCESHAGRTADAVAHLRHAIEASEHLRELARGDSDFDPIRGDPAFVELVGSD